MKLTERLTDIFSIDLRTLALFRVLLGSVVLISLLLRLPDLTAFYTDAGLLPRTALPETGNLWQLSLHAFSGSTWFQGLLFSIQLIAAFGLIAGWRTRLSNILSWILMVSLCARNPLVMVSGDTLMLCLLFWGQFLPLGARWSLDAALATHPPPAATRHLSIASAALLLQVIFVFFFNAVLQNDVVWREGTALHYALAMDSNTTRLGLWLRGEYGVLAALTHLSWWLGILSPLLLLWPFCTQLIRGVTLALLAFLQMVLLLCLELGPLPYAMLTALSVFIGSRFWEALNARHDRQHPGKLRIYYDRQCSFCHRICLLLQHFLALRHCEVLPAQDSPRARALFEANGSWVVMDTDDQAYLRWAAFVVLLQRSPLLGWLAPVARTSVMTQLGDAVYRLAARHHAGITAVTTPLLKQARTAHEAPAAAQWLAGLALLAVTLSNLGSIGYAPVTLQKVIQPPLTLLGLNQFWNLFAPRPAADDGWFIAPGILEDSNSVDALRPDAPLSFAPPDFIAGEYRNVRWRAWQMSNYNIRRSTHHQRWAHALCMEWNRTAKAGQQLVSLKLIYMLRRIPPIGKTPQTEQVILWRQECALQNHDKSS